MSLFVSSLIVFLMDVCEFHLAHSERCCAGGYIHRSSFHLLRHYMWCRFSPLFCKGRYHTLKLRTGLKGHAAGSILFCFSLLAAAAARYIHPASQITISLFVSLALLCLPVNKEIAGRTLHLPPLYIIYSCYVAP